MARTKPVSKSAKKTTTPVAETTSEPVTEPTPVQSAVSDTENVVVTQTEDDLTQSWSAFTEKLASLSQLLNSLKSDFKTLEKRATRELKAAQKTNSKRKNKKGTRNPSGFVKPTRMSNKLSAFLGKEPGSEMARTEVTREINKYIRANNLQDPDNGRIIKPDAALASLLKVSKGEQLTYFNLQKFMKPHFCKAGETQALADVQN